MGIRLGPDDWAVRCNLVFAPDGHMRDFTAGHIDTADARELIAALQAGLGDGTLEFHPGVQYRHILVWRGKPGQPCPLVGTTAQPPHDVPDQPTADHLPKGPGRDFMVSLMERSKPILANHPANARRVAAGQKPATQIWLWGHGKAPTVTPFEAVYGKRGAMISAVDLVRGVGALLGWHRVDVPGATGYLDTDYAAKGRYAVEAVGAFDVVCVHVEAPDEASHEGRADAKVGALERIDADIVGPLLAALPGFGDWRLLVEPDHRTTLATRAHAHGPVAFAACGAGITPDTSTRYDEPTAAAGLSFDPGHTLMRWMLS